MSRHYANTHGRASSSTSAARRPSLIAAAAGEASFAFAFDNPAFADRVLCVRLLPDLACGDALPPSIAAVDPHLPFCPSGKAAKVCCGAGAATTTDDDEPMLDTHTHAHEENVGKGKEAGGFSEGESDDDVEDDVTEEASMVMRLHVNSMLLAGRSRFFLSLFSAGMIETSQKEVWLSIHEEEKAALLDVLGFLYRGTFKSFDFDHLLKVLLLSDKYDVPVTLEAASRAIQKHDLTPHQCEVLLDLQSSLQENKAFNPAVARGRDLLEAEFSNLDQWWSRPDVWSLGHHAMRLILGGERTQVTSENTAFAILEKWLSVDWEARHRYIPELAPLLRWAAMDVNYLQDVVRNCAWLTCFDWFREIFTEAVMWHAFPDARKSYVLANTDSSRFHHRPQPSPPSQSLKIEWEIDVGSLAKGVKHLDSPSYQHKGYHFALQLCREKLVGREGSSVGLYVFANSGPSVVGGGTVDEGNKPCFLAVTSQITVRNPVTRQAQSVGTTDHYTGLNTAWGWKDFLRPISWEDLLAKRCNFVSPHGTLAFSATIHLPTLH
jgi:hypothetical protein